MSQDRVRFVYKPSVIQSINQSKHISIAPYVASESEAHIRSLGQVDLYGVTEMSNRLIPVDIYGKLRRKVEHRIDIMRYRILNGTVSVFLCCAVSKVTYFHCCLSAKPLHSFRLIIAIGYTCTVGHKLTCRSGLCK